MEPTEKLNNPILVAVWPGMGQVAINAGFYMLAKLSMDMLAEFMANELFDVEGIEVRGGLIGPSAFPRNRVFVWKDPAGKRDILVFIGEAQPPIGKYMFCQRIVEFAKTLGAERVFTFAAMATQMHPEHACRIFGVATNEETLGELKRLELDILEEGKIGGLNGILLAVAAENGMKGACLLGEIPHIFAQFPFPKASLAVLETFSTMTGIEMDFTELTEQAREVEEKLGELLSAAEEAIAQGRGEESDVPHLESTEAEKLSHLDREKIEKLFEEAKGNRSKAYELKAILDRFEVFKEYEDRFLDLFKKP